MAQQVATAFSGHHERGERALAPDLARGAMLLIIAVVHAHMFRQLAGGMGAPDAAGWVDGATTTLVTLLAENRGYPMFAALFGYGLMRIAMRHGEAAPGGNAAGKLRRRGFWLLIIGFLHTLLLSYGDILSVYGVIALALAAMSQWSGRRVLRLGLIFLVVAVPIYALGMTALLHGADGADADAGFWAAMGLRLAAWPFSTMLFVLISVFPFSIGMLAARRGILDRPQAHLPLLRALAGWGICLAVLGGVPQALIATGFWMPGMMGETASLWLHLVTGYAGGLGYAALIGLLVVRVGEGRGMVVRALVATGQRSLSCYLWQSVAWFGLFMPFTLNLAARLSYFEAVLVGALVWLGTVIWADMLGRRGRQGPAEAFLRRRLAARAA